ncbi:MAG: PhzF family phenazine biosynthesis protein [Candidatus Binataceae bacterium]
MRSSRFVTADVFTRKALEGNQLAVFTDARGLTDAEMQALAREMKFSETTFVLPRDPAVERERGVKVRIFTIEQELPFAGHPTLGTAYVLSGPSGASEISLDLKVGRIPVVFSERDGAMFGEMTQRDPEFGAIHDPQEVARATGLEVADFDPHLPIETVSTGNAFVIVPIRSLAVIRGLTLEWRRAAEYLKRSDALFFYFVTRETESPWAKLHARMIFYGGEDPATGSAAGPAVAWMVKHGVAQSNEQLIIEQGIEVRRPSQIYVRATAVAAGIRNVRVGGYVVEVMRGEVAL